MEYRIGGKTYRIVASLSRRTAVTGEPAGEMSVRLAPGDGAANPAHLYVFCSGDEKAAERLQNTAVYDNLEIGTAMMLGEILKTMP